MSFRFGMMSNFSILVLLKFTFFRLDRSSVVNSVKLTTDMPVIVYSYAEMSPRGNHDSMSVIIYFNF